MIFGPGDFAASMGIPQLSVGAIDPDYPADQWHYVLSRIVVTARAFGLQAIDGPYAQTQGEYERAERILVALGQAEKGHLGAVMFEGEMVDEASRKMAEQVAAKGRVAGLEPA